MYQDSSILILFIIDEIVRSITSIENLSNEIFYEIFDYLDGCHIYQAFSDLNYRFENIVNSSSLLFKIIFHHSRPTEEFIKNYKQIILFKKSQILSIHFSSSLLYNQMILSLNINSSFDHLECLVFHSIQPDILTSLLPKLAHLPRFFSLTIDTQRTLNDLTDVYRLIFDLPKLKYLRFFAMEPETTGVTVSLPINIDKQFNNIKHLVIDHPCSFNEIFSIISYTSQINRLSFIHKKYSISNIGIISSNILSNLTDISIYGDDITFDEFDIFITKIYSKLKVISLKSLAKDMNYLNADRWEHLIRKYFPQLEKFYLTFYVFFEYGNGVPKYIGNSNRFNSSFWIERQWVFEAQIDFDKIMYSIHPFRKRWYEMINSLNELSKSMRIVFMTIRYDETLKQIISHISSVAEIYHLEIYEEVYTDMLIEILDLLPELNSVQIPSLPYSNSIYI